MGFIIRYWKRVKRPLLLVHLVLVAVVLWGHQRAGRDERVGWRPLLTEEPSGESTDAAMGAVGGSRVGEVATVSKAASITEQGQEQLFPEKSQERLSPGKKQEQPLSGKMWKQEPYPQGSYQVVGTVDYLWLKENQIRVRLKTGKSGNILLLLEREPSGNEKLPAIGNRMEAVGELWEFQDGTVPGQFQERSYYQSQGYTLRIEAKEWRVTDTRIAWWRQTLWQFRQRLITVYERLLPTEKAGVLSAMLLGEKQNLDSEIKEGYQASGISHLLAVSGLHVSLLGGAVLYLLRKLRWPWVCPRAVADSIAIFLMISYGMLLDYPISASRAVIMIVLSVVAGMAGRTYDMPTALSCALVLLVFQEPAAAYQAGFQLSFGAVAGIWLLYPVLDRAGNPRVHSDRSKTSQPEKNVEKLLGYVGKGIRGSLLTSLSVLLLTLPVQMYHFSEISLPGLWNNLLVLPLMPLVLLTGLAGGFCGLLAGGAGFVLGRFCLGSTCLMLEFYEWVCELGKRMDWAVQTTGRPAGWQIVAYYAIVAALLLLWNRGAEKRRRIQAPLFLGVAVLVLLLRFPASKVTLLDVGQGDGIVVQSAAGSTFLVDCGSSNVSGVGNWRLLPFLKQEGVQRIDGILITHMDGDHNSGILELLEEGRIPVAALWLPAVYREQEALQEERYQTLLATAKKQGVTVGYLEPGDRLQDGQVTFVCLGPDPARACLEQNAASLVLKLLVRDTSLLLTGDMGQKEERILMETQERQQFDILKVGHHGSKHSSSEEFLQWCGAKVALISSSLKNRYGHPHPETLERLSEAGCQVFGTANAGSIQIRWEHGSVRFWHYSR